MSTATIRSLLIPPPSRTTFYLKSVFLLLALLAPQWSGCETDFGDPLVSGRRTLTLEDSPYLVRQDVLVDSGAELEIEAGVEVRFKPEVGMTVRGVLKAQGTPSKKVTFSPAEAVLERQPNRTLRLVDGPSVNQGIVQVLESGSWRSVCTNSRNWTLADMEVACKQLGFTGGEWYHWYPHLNDTRQILYQNPGCSGYEAGIELCRWDRRRMGSGSCDHHPDLGLLCLPFHHTDNRASKGHWRGLRFESAPYRKDLTADNTLYVRTSRSVLSHVVVTGAGRGKFLGRANATSAIESWGVPPVMRHILVENSAYNGINITNPQSVVTIEHANVTNNRGYGVYVNTTHGYVDLRHSSVSGNMGDGVKYHFHDFRPETKLVDGVDVHDFCTYSTTYSQTYPFLMVAEQYRDSTVKRNCGKRFYTKHGYLLTLHFTHLVSDEDGGADIEVRDGSDANARLITTVQVRNYTRPESVVTTGNNVFIVFRAREELRSEVFMEVTAGRQKAYDLNVTDTVIDDNSGRGLWVEWMRSAVHLHRSQIHRHNHVAGMHVNWGAGDVNITYSDISRNFVDGVNITYGGGARNVSWSSLSDNVGMGLAVYLNETTVNFPVRQETTVSYSNISLNYDIGVLVGNFCGPAVVNISSNYFVFGRYVGLEVLSCWRDSDLEGVERGDTDLFIGHNHFEFNKQVAVRLSPLARAKGSIEHNDFNDNFEGCLYMYNEDDFILEIQTVDLLIHENRFKRNTGSFVTHLGLSHYDHRKGQHVLMHFNWVQDNIITEPWKGLNPRSEVAAPVVIASSNVRVERNLIDNPGSKYELGSRLIEPNTELDCRKNWLGHKDERRVWEKVFDRDDRYNLAKIAYVPYLLSNNINTELVLERPEWEPEFMLDRDAREVGGEVTGVEELREDGVYIVRRDINVRPNGRLKITPGVTLKFEHSIGMMVSGELIAEGDLQGGQPILTLLDNVRENVSNVPVRLVGGATVREGRLQVSIDGEWGTVCNFGWTIESAALACQQMGWVLNPEDWDLPPNEVPQAGAGGPILMSNVRCGPLDTDLTRCKWAERTDMFLNSCSHSDDVGLRCYDVSWAGARLGMTSKRSKLYDVKVERAGLYDYRLYKFRPAVQTDFSHHVFEHLEVSDNDHDGLGVMYSDIYFPDRVNYVQHSRFVNNKRHGISFRQLGMLIEDSEIRGNGRAGVHHDPMLDKLEQRELAEWMSLIGEREKRAIITIPESEEGLSESDPIIIPEKESRLIVTQALNNSDLERVYHIRCERDEFVIGMQLINPFHNYTSEVLVIYDYRDVKVDELVEVWNVSRDIATFPIISSSYAITMVLKPGQAALGNMMMLLTPINCADLPGNCNTRAYHINPLHRSKIVPGSFPRLTIQRTKISHNEQGLSALHYNRYLGHDSQVYLRKANESIEVFHCEISSNRREAFHVFTPFRELNQFNISEITYMINHTRFLDNGRGIFQYSKDLRDSNNLYHWVLRENLFERNSGGGMDISLPYVWQYNENYTHTVHFDSNRAFNNKDFGITVSGHFARVYVVNNTMFDNFCHEGLLALRGMEKESWIFANNIQNNDGTYMVEFEMDSHSEIMNFVEAYFTQNVVKNNAHAAVSRRHQAQPASYTIGVKGVQKFNVTDNIFSNPGMDYELLAGIRTARVSNYLNAEQNYWGTANLDRIRERLFDFDDWNSYAITHFLPYYLEAAFDAPLSSSYEQPPKIDLDNLGGRLEENLRLVERPGRPYLIRSDLTVMPGVTLTIEPGAELEFFPNVGMLVLGTLHAQGNIHRNIVMRPARIEDVIKAGGRRQQLHSDTKYSNKRQDNRGSKFLHLSEEEDFDVRLCTADVNGTVCPENANQGFVEIYNRTTMQWVPMCDKRFTERNAQVVCKQLGFSDLNVFLDFDQRIEYNAESLVRIIYWPEPYQCVGTEPRLAHCPLRLNGQIYGHDYVCDWQGKDFAFVHCGDTNLGRDYEYWGGVRFSVKEFEQELFHARIHDAVTHHATVHKHESILEYVQVIGAGMLHGEKSPAVQAIMVSPLLSYLNITHSAHDGINIVSPSGMMNMLYNKLENNLGVGISAAVLTGEVREAKLSAFEPVETIPVPYDNFGLVDICDPQKEIAIEERVLLYYKYDNNPVDCVKIFSSVYDVKPIGFRLLQYNLVNSTGEPWIPDHITLYDGDLYNRTTRPMVTIKVDGESDENVLHQTTRTNAMSVKFHATGAREHMGFVAEVVTLPFSIVTQNRDLRHNMSFSVFDGNQRGAILYTSAGENNPIVTMQRNHLTDNCLSLYGNFSTCQSAIHLDVQNTQDVFFYNNFLTGNIGGLMIRAGSSGTATAMRAMLHNNVFEENLKKVTLNFEGRKTTPYQQVTLFRNYVTRSNVSHEAVVRMMQVVCNATYNTFHNNRGKMIVEVTGFHNVRLPIYQSFTHNGFYNNYAYGLHCDMTTLGYCRWGNRATVVAGSAGQEYVDNVFYNIDNDYELMTLNRSVWDVWKTPINAKYNYWAYNETYAVAGRIKDLHDEEGLLEVDFTPFHMNNKTLLSGKCQPGWTLLGDTCFMYLGGPMTYRQAVDFCAKDNATLPTITNFYQYHVLTHYLEQQQEDWRYYDMVWINDLDNADCNVFVDSTVKSISCDFMLPALCEMDEHVHLAPPTSVYELPKEMVYSLAVLAAMLFLVLLVCCCWCNKTRHRKKERLQRRDSIRMSKSSIGTRSLTSMTSTGFSDINYRRRFINNQSKTGTVSSTYQRQQQQQQQQPQRTPSGMLVSNSQQQLNATNATSFDSLAEKHSVSGLTSMDPNASYADAFQSHLHSTNPMPDAAVAAAASGSAVNLNSLGSHLSPNGGRSSFADTHDVHYAPGGGGGTGQGTTLTFPQVHSASGYDISSYDNGGYRPDTRQSNQIGGGGNPNVSGVWPSDGGHDLSASLNQGPPGYNPSSSRQNLQSASGQRSDSVADMKRDLKARLDNRGGSDSGDDDFNTTGTTSDASSDPQADRGTGEYQTMDSRTGVPAAAAPFDPSSFRGPSSGRSPFGSRALPETPSAAASGNIPSVPGYAKPIVTPTGTAQRPFQPPPDPPRSRPPAVARPEDPPPPPVSNAARSRRPLLETSLDHSDEEEEPGPPHPPRSRSVGHILETNLDDDDAASQSGGEEAGSRQRPPLLPNSNGHSRSLGENGFPRLSVGPAAPMLETDM